LFDGAYCRFDSVTRESAGWVTISKCEGRDERTGCTWVNRELYRMNKDGYLVVDANEISRIRGECGVLLENRTARDSAKVQRYNDRMSQCEETLERMGQSDTWWCPGSGIPVRRGQ
jgi:hypothetical protein